MKSSTSFRLSSLLFFIIIAGYLQYDVDANECEYKISVKTADVSYAGTNSRINLILTSKSANFEIPDLANWGINGPYYDYFERGNLDVFIGKADCIKVCNIIVTSDGSGSMSGWMLEYVKVATTGPINSNVFFAMNQWLASAGGDPAPYSLSSVSGGKCA